MKKFNFSESEKAFQKAAEARSIQKLHRLADSVNSNDSETEIESQEERAKQIEELQNRMIKLKEDEPELYRRLNLSPEEETIVFSKLGHTEDYSEKLTLLKKIFERLPPLDTENVLEDQISSERKEHTNKRLNVRKGWLPLK